jgi:hypothetical protein
MDGRFLELVVYAVGGRRGFILFPEGRGGRGWNKVVDELCKVMVFFGNHVWVFSRWCVVFGGEGGCEGGFGFEALLPKLGWGLALCGWCSTVVRGGSEVRGPYKVIGLAG